MLSSDWSSDVCSSDLPAQRADRRSCAEARAAPPRLFRLDQEAAALRRLTRRRTLMALNIETFSNAKGGNAFFKAIGHPLAARQAKDLLQRLRAGPVAIYDPLGYAQAFAEIRSEEHTSELQSLMRNSYSAFGLKKKNIRT